MSSVCIFCENSVLQDENYKEEPYAYGCRAYPNKRVVDPIIGTPTFMVMRSIFCAGDFVEFTLEGYSPDDHYMKCMEINKHGRCEKFKRISEKEEKAIFPSEVEEKDILKIIGGK